MPLTIGFFYLAIALWRLTGKGRTSSRWAGVDFGSLVRAVILTAVVAATELALIAIASALAV